jgi:hypothetical protein
MLSGPASHPWHILLGKHELNRFAACDWRSFMCGNKLQLRRLIVSIKNTAHLSVSGGQSFPSTCDKRDDTDNNQRSDGHLFLIFSRSGFAFNSSGRSPPTSDL